MANSMKMPFPDGASELGSIAKNVFYHEGEKCDSISWKIEGFRNILQFQKNKEVKFKSKKFTSGDNGSTLTWCLALVKSQLNGRGCFYLFPCFMPENDCKEVFVKIKLIFIDRYGDRHQYATAVDESRFDPRNQYSSVFLLLDAVVLDYFTIVFEILQSDSEKFCLFKQLGDAFENKKFADIKLLSNDGKVYEAHKMILVTRSSVFAAMFTHPMKENEEQEVKIADMDGEVIEEMLRYMYTDKSVKLRLLAKDLFVAAEKYDLKGLKKICEDELLANLSISNAVEVLLFSDLHDATRLKSEVIKFITMKENVEVFNTEEWKSLEQPDLLRTLCEVAVSRE